MKFKFPDRSYPAMLNTQPHAPRGLGLPVGTRQLCPTVTSLSLSVISKKFTEEDKNQEKNPLLIGATDKTHVAVTLTKKRGRCHQREAEQEGSWQKHHRKMPQQEI